MKAARACASWIEVEDAISPGNLRLMGVAEDHCSDAGGVRMEIKILARMKHIDQFSIELNGFSGRQFAADSVVVHIAANRCEGRDGS